MPDEKLSLGAAIDQIITALETLDTNSRETVLSAVCSHLKITLKSTNATGADGEGNRGPNEQIGEREEKPATPVTKQKQAHQVDIRAFKDEKKPNSATQMACVVAYYLQELAPEEERMDSISKGDLEKYFKQAKYPLPETIQQLLPNSKRSGYFDTAGRGSYKLNAVGYNLVAHNLPSEKSGD